MRDRKVWAVEGRTCSQGPRTGLSLYGGLHPLRVMVRVILSYIDVEPRINQQKYTFLFWVTVPLNTLSASRLLLISAPSRRVCRSALDVSAPRSFPARSMRENLPCILPRRRRMIWNTAWLRDECALADVCPEVLGERRVHFKTARNICYILKYSVNVFYRCRDIPVSQRGPLLTNQSSSNRKNVGCQSAF